MIERIVEGAADVAGQVDATLAERHARAAGTRHAFDVRPRWGPAEVVEGL